ncbi:MULTISPECIES: deoxynucleoside kinase [Staphylococcus]|jgi:deoxyguanosine kinase|uniref:Deoxyadenosine kinase n=1 Tax=Staphylococcus nepalensis TaxID=214473 RepID=A0A291JND3_9STAP|nr:MULTISPECIES: deoxynucleoside kinase [Staphylococcus]VDG67994.1 deoxyguanosine kinase [Lacrimispora indolis]ATH60993.1 deoxyguanosine kinase [Staphylococcus nepalensis]ATH66024.1 deoxyguanosine kinase [Staphylococcus nepalensis]AWI45414.1 deoxyguanosine kinase [Staphylococcus nepalensis]MBO1206422.1 deoxynucleoside kinase [Staphylococcus nepalensis]
MKKQFIAVEGPIGVGKSSLAHKLSQTFNYYEEKEIVNENPFLSDFYEDISKWSFQTEMFFLCNRYKQFQDLASISTGIVSDYHIYKNKIFANNTLTPTEFSKFSRIYDILTEDLEMPNIIIFLDADLEVLKKRIALRNRSFEHQIEDDYLLNLKRDYNAYYSSLEADGERVIHIDTTDLDFMKQENDYNYILNLVKPLIGGNEHE